jgi:diguanylate cyclase (GGDEF)-like protein/PAS domain S-box-containing protein
MDAHDYRALLEQTPAISYVADFGEAHAFRYISPQVEAALGYPADHWLDVPGFWADHLHPDDQTEVIAEARAAVAEQRGMDLEYRMVRGDGQPVWIRERTTVVRNDNGRPETVHGVFVEITRDKEAEARETAILVAALDAIVTIDSEGRVVEFNPAAESMFGYTREESIGREMADLIVPPDLRPAHRAGLARAAAGRPQRLGERLTLTAQRADGSEFPCELTITRLQLPGRATFTGHIRDITDRVEAEEALRDRAYHDALTGLANRARLEERLQGALERARSDGTSVVLLYVDLDRFKLVNDSFGHAVGDEILTLAGRRMERTLRSGDLLARHGGDEFLVLLADVEGEAARVADAVARKLVHALAEPFAISGLEFQIEATVGVSVFPDDADSGDALLRHADAAMYAGKGKGPVALYTPETEDPRGRLALTRQLRQAVETEEFELHYQVVMPLAGGPPVGAEALLRWRHPERGMVSPGEFIRVAEESGLIVPIGDWVIDEVCRQARAWRDGGLDIWLSFNVSLRQLRTTRLAQVVADRSSAHGVDPACLVAEITESATMHEPAGVQRLLTELHDLGVRLAIDDFGAGFSSLGRLQEMPVDILKIDRLFLTRLAGDGRGPAIVGTIVQLADALGLTAVGEGIETEAQRRLLLERGCGLGQGYLLGRPAPAAQLAVR